MSRYRAILEFLPSKGYLRDKRERERRARSLDFIWQRIFQRQRRLGIFSRRASSKIEARHDREPLENATVIEILQRFRRTEREREKCIRGN